MRFIDPFLTFVAVLHAVGKWMVVIALILSVGGHWGVLQVTAWVGMTITYSQTDDLPTALVKTFNGKNPCNLCKFVSEGQKSDRNTDTQLELKKIDFFPSPVSEFLFAVPPPNTFPKIVSVGARTEAPPTPPPLFA